MRRSGLIAPEHLRNQLQMVVMHPDRRSRRRGVRHGTRVAVVDRHVGVPPLPVERRGANRIVIQRPQRRVGEPEVRTARTRHRQGARLATRCPRAEMARPASAPTPGHPIHIPARPRSTGVNADTKPPGLRSQCTPPSRSTRRTGNRLATTISWAPPGPVLGLMATARHTWPTHAAHRRTLPGRDRQTPRRAESLLRASLNSPSTAGRPTRTQ